MKCVQHRHRRRVVGVPAVVPGTLALTDLPSARNVLLERILGEVVSSEGGGETCVTGVDPIRSTECPRDRRVSRLRPPRLRRVLKGSEG